jgi:hypothetical protein
VAGKDNMNKKLIISLSTIGAIAAIVIGATVSYFGNSEISSGNTFIAGAIDLKIDNECHYNGRVCIDGYWQGTDETCDCTWQLMDLDGKAIFNFTDIKPGDHGEDTISLHVDTNPAWICAEISNIVQMENGCNTPEAITDDPIESCDDPGEGQGELWENLHFSIWMDDGASEHFCNNIKDDDEIYLIEDVSATDIQWPIADSQTGGSPIQDTCIGVAWYVPGAVGNIIQSDGVTGDITFSAYQGRHQDGFVCFPPVYYCGDGQVTGEEQCEPPYATDCSYCSQLTSQCVGPKVQTRDAYGNCDENCGCVEDPWSEPVCSVAECDAQCDSNDDCDDQNPGTEDICLDNCICENKSGTIIVTKQVMNDDGGLLNIGDFTLKLDGNTVTSGVSNTVIPGTHTVSEVGVFGYQATFSGDCDASGHVTVADGETKNCTITNNDIAPLITLVKSVDGGSADPDDFDVSIDGNIVTSGSSNSVTANTAHVIDEEATVPDYEFTSIDGISFKGVSCPGALEGTITLLPGDVVTCTITNTYNPVE